MLSNVSPMVIGMGIGLIIGWIAGCVYTYFMLK